MLCDSTTFERVILELYPVTYYKCDEALSTDPVQDYSGNANHGVYHVTINVTTQTKSLVVANPDAVSVQLAAVTSTNYAAAFSLINPAWAGTDTISASLAFSKTVADGGFLMGQEFFNATDRVFNFATAGSVGAGQLTLQYAIAGGTWQTYTTADLDANFSIDIYDGEPHIASFVIDTISSRVEIWLDGVAVLVSTAGGAMQVPVTHYIIAGQTAPIGSPSLNGYISHFVYWDRALSTEEMSALHGAWSCSIPLYSTCTSWLGTGIVDQEIDMEMLPDFVVYKNVTSANLPGFPVYPTQFLVQLLQRPVDKYQTISGVVPELTNSDLIQSWTPTGFKIGTWEHINEAGSTHHCLGLRELTGFFKMVRYTGNDPTSPVTGQILEHGLGVVPEMYVCASMTSGGTYVWGVYHKDITALERLHLHDPSIPVRTDYWNDTEPTDTGFWVKTTSINTLGKDYIAYLFASYPGVCKVGSYTGNSTINPVITCDFKPRAIWLKRCALPQYEWQWIDTCMNPANPATKRTELSKNSALLDDVGIIGSFNDDNIEISTLLPEFNENGILYVYIVFA